VWLTAPSLVLVGRRSNTLCKRDPYIVASPAGSARVRAMLKWVRRLGLALCACGAGCASTPTAQSAPTVLKDSFRQQYATIQSLDKANQLIGVRGPDGDMTIPAGDAMRYFDELRIGDRITVTYYDATAAELTTDATTSETAPPTEQTHSFSTPEGTRPAKSSARTLTNTVKVVSVGAAGDAMTVSHADGSVGTVPVETQQGQQFVRTLHPGENIRLVQRESVAVQRDTRSR
jgi:hypothetical protein